MAETDFTRPSTLSQSVGEGGGGSERKFHVSIPFAYSSAGFGVLLNAPGDGTVSVSPAGAMTWALAAQKQLDFWLTTTPKGAAATDAAPIYGQYADAVGHAPPLPAPHALFWQCRLRYRNQAIVEQIAQGYAQRNLSLGMLVIDFQNQRRDGDMHMNEACYQNISAMTERVRDLTGGNTMVSFWCDVKADADAHDALQSGGCLFGGRVDTTSQSCRDLVWQKYVKPNYFAHGVKDFWLDEDDLVSIAPVEPETGANGTTQLVRAPASAYGRIWCNRWIQTFADGLRAEGAEGMILTRSVWAGAARHGVVLWSSDIHSSFEQLASMVPQVSSYNLLR